MLLSLVEPGLAWRAYHVDQDRIVRGTHAPVAADIDRLVEPDARMVGARRIDVMYSQLPKGTPIADRYAGIDQGRLNRVSERFLLPLRQLGTEIGNHHIPAREDHCLTAHGGEHAAPRVDDLGLSRRSWFPDIAHGDHGAVKTDAHRRPRAIEPAIIGCGGDDVLRGTSWNRRWHKAAHQQSCD